jgi:DNA polymerase-1
VTDYALYDEAGIVERCGVEPGRYPLLAAMRGDSSDNLPGVPGIGEKTAAKLLATYRDIDDIYAISTSSHRSCEKTWRPTVSSSTTTCA